jgi:hypothetical protein
MAFAAPKSLALQQVSRVGRRGLESRRKGWPTRRGRDTFDTEPALLA